jgi:hypothetical protein
MASHGAIVKAIGHFLKVSEPFGRPTHVSMQI